MVTTSNVSSCKSLLQRWWSPTTAAMCVVQLHRSSQMPVSSLTSITSLHSVHWSACSTSSVIDHILPRYLGAIINGTKNPHRKAVVKDIVDALLISCAGGGKPAEYWSQEVQEVRLQATYNKWLQVGGVWSAAATKVSPTSLNGPKEIELTY